MHEAGNTAALPTKVAVEAHCRSPKKKWRWMSQCGEGIAEPHATRGQTARTVRTNSRAHLHELHPDTSMVGAGQRSGGPPAGRCEERGDARGGGGLHGDPGPKSRGAGPHAAGVWEEEGITPAQIMGVAGSDPQAAGSVPGVRRAGALRRSGAGEVAVGCSDPGRRGSARPWPATMRKVVVEGGAAGARGRAGGGGGRWWLGRAGWVVAGGGR